ncbi:MAG: hypothetical protein IT270_21045, partial [Saprospiraceae bacterium]|nr:hypothetical protein [Saprospiraceae bacterium]
MPKNLLLTCLAGLLCLSLNGQTMNWLHILGNEYPDRGYDIQTDVAGNVLVLGSFEDTLDFDLGPGTSFLYAVNGYTYVLKLNAAGEFLWVKQNQTPTSGVRMETDASGNVYITGYVIGTQDLDPGPGTFMVSSTQVATYIVKLDQEGDFLWAKVLENINAGYATPDGLVLDPTGGLYLIGATGGEVDFDPGPGQYIPNPPNGRFISKYDNEGNFQWVNPWNPAPNIELIDFDVDGQGNVFIGGEYSGTIDFDPGPGTASPGPSAGQKDVFVQKFDPDGNLIWVRAIQGVQAQSLGGLSVDVNGNVVLFGEFQNPTDLDPGPDTLLFDTDDFRPDLYLQKLDPEGNLLWANQYSTDFVIRAYSVATDALGNIYTGGSLHQSTGDFDPGPGVIQLSTPGSSAFIMKSDFKGNTVWAHQILGGNSYTKNLTVGRNNHVYGALEVQYDGSLLLEYDTIPFVAPGNEIMLLDLSQEFAFPGNVFADFNENGMQDAGEPGLINARLSALPDSVYTMTNSVGNFSFYYDITGDTVRPKLNWPQLTFDPPFLVADSLQTPMVFAVWGGPVRDVCVAVVEETPFRPGFENRVSVQVTNVGMAPVDSIPVNLILVEPMTPFLELVSAEPAPLNINGNLLEWVIPHLEIAETAVIDVVLKTPAVHGIGARVTLSSSAYLADDGKQLNNQSRVITETVGSFDPNDKKITPEFADPPALDTTDFRYVIRFQNTGTYPADFVVILDTLPDGLDLSTVDVIAASHPYTWRFVGANVLEFRFDPIYLPDSTSNEPESHGFVAFTARVKPGMSVGAMVANRAGIYFDYNEPVITNYAVMQVISVKVTEPGGKIRLEINIAPNPVPAYAKIKIGLPELSEPATISVFNNAGQ